MTCHRGHSSWHQVSRVKLLKNGKTRIKKECDYILGVLGVESKNHGVVVCSDLKKGEEPPAGMLPIGTL